MDEFLSANDARALRTCFRPSIMLGRSGLLLSTRPRRRPRPRTRKVRGRGRLRVGQGFDGLVAATGCVRDWGLGMRRAAAFH